jgi:hypothetical protein
MRLVALLAVYNEERFIRACLEHLIGQGAEVYVIDNQSTDRTAAIAAEYAGRGLAGLETLPRAGAFSLRAQLARKEQLAAELQADWFLHADADEFHVSPIPGQTLMTALAEADRAGCNAVNFLEFTFTPTREAPDHDHSDFRATMRWYYPFLPSYPHRLNAWRQPRAGVDLQSTGGHEVRFAGRRMLPRSLYMRHYLCLSAAHAAEKYAARAFDAAEVAADLHTWRARLRPERIQFPSERELRRYTSDAALDGSRPRRRHFLEEAALRA